MDATRKRGVSGFMRFVGWATLLAIPCWAAAEPYHRFLARAVEGLVGLTGARLTLERLDVLAPNDLGFFAAMCLATASVPWRGRLRAIALGFAALVPVEVLTSTLAVMWAMAQSADAGASATVTRLREDVMATLPWVSAPVAWYALLGTRTSRSAAHEEPLHHDTQEERGRTHARRRPRRPTRA